MKEEALIALPAYHQTSKIAKMLNFEKSHVLTKHMFFSYDFLRS